MNPSVAFQFAVSKLRDGWTMESLPLESGSTFWNEIRSVCGLTAPEVVLLQKQIAQRKEGFIITLSVRVLF